MSYEFASGKIFDLEEEFVPSGKRACGANVMSLVHLPEISVVYRDVVSRAGRVSVQHHYDAYHETQGGPDKARWEAGTNDVSLKKFLVQEMLWERAADTGDVTERALSFEWQLIQAVGLVVLVSKKDYLGLTRDL